MKKKREQFKSNCRNLNICLLDRKCLTECAIYKATVKADGPGENIYFESTKRLFKQKYRNHKMYFIVGRYRNNINLFSYLWNITEIRGACIKGKNSYSKRYSYIDDRFCRHYLKIVACTESNKFLNAKSEVVSKCGHARIFLQSSRV